MENQKVILQIEKGPGKWDQMASYADGKIVSYVVTLWQYSRKLKITGRIFEMSKVFPSQSDVLICPQEGCENFRFIVKSSPCSVLNGRILKIGGGQTIMVDLTLTVDSSTLEVIDKKIINYFNDAP